MNAIVIIAPNRENFLEYCLPSVEHFAGKYNVNVEVVREEAYDLKATSHYNYKIFEKFQVNKFTDKYDRVLRLDADIIFSPYCPDLFKKFGEEKIWGVFEDNGNRRSDRRRQMILIQQQLGDLGWNNGYINAGVILTSKAHVKLYDIDKEYLDLVIPKGLGKFKEQSLINWRIRRFGYELGNMGYKFNHMSKNTDSKHRPENSYIVHFAGRQAGKIDKMRKLYKFWYV